MCKTAALIGWCMQVQVDGGAEQRAAHASHGPTPNLAPHSGALAHADVPLALAGGGCGGGPSASTTADCQRHMSSLFPLLKERVKGFWKLPGPASSFFMSFWRAFSMHILGYGEHACIRRSSSGRAGAPGSSFRLAGHFGCGMHCTLACSAGCSPHVLICTWNSTFIKKVSSLAKPDSINDSRGCWPDTYNFGGAVI